MARHAIRTPRATLVSIRDRIVVSVYVGLVALCVLAIILLILTSKDEH